MNTREKTPKQPKNEKGRLSALTARHFSAWLSAAFFCLFFCLSFSHAETAFGAGPDRGPKPADLTELSIEELMNIEVEDVSGASKFTQKATDAPSSVSIVTAEDIKRYGYRTLAEILQSVRGFYVGNDRSYSYAGIRGFSRPGDYNTRMLLLIDGHRINDGIYNQAFLGTEFPLDVDLIDRVEIIRGPSHSLYGSNAFLGVINVLTRRAADMDGLELSGEGGSFYTFKERASYGREFSSGFQALLSGTHFSSKGQNLYFKEFDTPATHNGWADSCDSWEGGSLFTTLKHKGFSLQGVFASRDKDIPTASYGTIFNENRSWVRDERAYLDLSYKTSLNETTDLRARAFYDHYLYKGDYIFDYPPRTLNKDYVKGEWWGSELEFVKKFLDTHTAVIGASYTDYFLLKQQNYDDDPYYSYLDDNRSAYNWAAYLQDSFSLLDNRVIISAGLRYDYYSTFEGTTNYRTSLIYRPIEQTALKLNYGKGFRAPNPYELYYDDNNETTKSNPDLQPEKIDSYEVVLEHYWKNYRFSLSGYYFSIRDLITLWKDPADGLLVFKNLDEVESKGAEFEVEGKWSHGVESRISYSFQKSKDKHTGDTLANSPEHLVKSNLYVPIFGRKLAAGLEVQYTSSCKSYKGDRVDDFVIANLTLLSRDLWKNLEISGTLYNLFDEDYGTPASDEHLQSVIPQDGRTFRVKLTYKF
ncbi:iron complex outermembrane recepter protein [Syntrophus gentianae]|uniref:Iron complex outermembrane recepter protein n=1 Tax=Syntrophus gentianae TaxID=43775 RepID=A0A1H7UH90_9BACT|nr:TonB-dependent receptor [Syntrophus gentianae]SEL96420.1 iron complex outermembrane recepter protein [Syntrophus gentianae]